MSTEGHCGLLNLLQTHLFHCRIQPEGAACLLDRLEKKEGNKQKHTWLGKLLPTSCPLTCHWLKQVTWPSQCQGQVVYSSHRAHCKSQLGNGTPEPSCSRGVTIWEQNKSCRKPWASSSCHLLRAVMGGGREQFGGTIYNCPFTSHHLSFQQGRRSHMN